MRSEICVISVKKMVGKRSESVGQQYLRHLQGIVSDVSIINARYSAKSNPGILVTGS